MKVERFSDVILNLIALKLRAAFMALVKNRRQIDGDWAERHDIVAGALRRLQDDSLDKGLCRKGMMSFVYGKDLAPLAILSYDFDHESVGIEVEWWTASDEEKESFTTFYADDLADIARDIVSTLHPAIEHAYEVLRRDLQGSEGKPLPPSDPTEKEPT